MFCVFHLNLLVKSSWPKFSTSDMWPLEGMVIACVRIKHTIQDYSTTQVTNYLPKVIELALVYGTACTIVHKYNLYKVDIYDFGDASSVPVLIIRESTHHHLSRHSKHGR